ncbi:FecR family protein [Luteimonas aquatica]|uniref:FecR family protein n=1 Tax=Luteimonas aquatica TaxID=450364 RepID=UPI001F5AE08D|nr:FecR domain-containing protein [Luteimonas aquatica]
MNAAASRQGPRDGRAEAWAARLMAPDCTAAEHAAFEDWLAEAPGNVEAYVEAEQAHALAASLREDPFVRAAARGARRRPPRQGWRWLPAVSVAATLAIAVGAVAWRMWPAGEAVAPIAHATAVGEQRQLTLADGTRLLLDTDSAVDVRLGAGERLLEVRRGRVQIDVGRDPRPFAVRAGGALVHDIGTLFQVSRERGAGARIGLIEGAVQVSLADAPDATRQMLAPGEQVAVEADGTLGRKRGLDLETARAWPRGDLVFRERPLDQLLEEANRYSTTQLRLGDPALGGIRVSGVFHAGDQDALSKALEQGWGLRAERTGTHEIVLQRQAGSR